MKITDQDCPMCPKCWCEKMEGEAELRFNHRKNSERISSASVMAVELVFACPSCKHKFERYYSLGTFE
jgi:hypothetical protein